MLARPGDGDAAVADAQVHIQPQRFRLHLHAHRRGIADGPFAVKIRQRRIRAHAFGRLGSLLRILSGRRLAAFKNHAHAVVFGIQSAVILQNVAALLAQAVGHERAAILRRPGGAFGYAKVYRFTGAVGVERHRHLFQSHLRQIKGHACSSGAGKRPGAHDVRRAGGVGLAEEQRHVAFRQRQRAVALQLQRHNGPAAFYGNGRTRGAPRQIPGLHAAGRHGRAAIPVQCNRHGNVAWGNPNFPLRIVSRSEQPLARKRIALAQRRHKKRRQRKQTGEQARKFFLHNRSPFLQIFAHFQAFPL